MKRSSILDQATENFTSITGLQVQVYALSQKDKNADGYLDIESGEKNLRLKFELRNEIRHTSLPDFLSKVRDEKNKWILISQYIPMPLKKLLKELGINYLESAGNTFIQTDNILIYISDQKVTATRVPAEGKVWKASGLKMIFAILNNPQLLKLSYRQLAIGSGIALGNIGPFLEELRSEGFLIEVQRKGRVLAINREQLIQRWIELYTAVLRPKLSFGKFRLATKGKTELWEEWKTSGFVWGGENAGGLLTNYLNPELYTIYTQEKKTKIMVNLRLIPDPNGKIEMFEQFWPMEVQQSLEMPHVVPPLIAYAELATSLDSRNNETAERIKEKYLKCSLITSC